ncbi:UDP-3-O-(3-hydroxymyristoyl)glucosamine N-acyltransferase [Thiomicrospira cyclica]|uniref:UDP-3-O-acylglucosamine N-acyltransferase n=1 Tax=Thiomicrospira cyclica (strain DSM 14477 / JCM 11371 / ALM1) TaxID=717773 RepID=F6DCZ3_THICA|nr:UDP-3-O-(3-hydroxymyristoyl)glucosamine N-acyltransferase [Thiomicrospira cyclica]AEG31729.1 UDP-3-O-(3-hydroxymyristoyl) glucosamine N-acyltransferase [Thiomicrospira cyclica ALM1]
MNYSGQQLLNHLLQFGMDVQAHGPLPEQLSGIAPLDQATPEQMSFVSQSKHFNKVASSQAGLLLIKPHWLEKCQPPMSALLVADPYAAFAVLAQFFYQTPRPASGIHPQAVVNSGAHLASSAVIGPFVVIEAGAVIGEDVVIGSHCRIAAGSKIGARTRIDNNVSILHNCEVGNDCHIKSGAVIGGDGFGFAPHQGRWLKIPQVGRVIIGDRVSIGSNTCIDRGALEDTRIGDDCIIDNLIHIAHNVSVGKGTAMAAQVGIAGSTHIGEYCVFAGQAGVVGHTRIADKTTLMARGGIIANIDESGVYSGFPAVPHAQWQKTIIQTRKLTELTQRIKQLEKHLAKFSTDN